MNRPNILYIHSHDTGRYIEPYGHDIPTPHLQNLADEGVLFRQAFCAAPTCSPSRAALLTGQSAHSSGMLGLAHLGWSLYNYDQHLLHTLRREAGYVSALAGIQHIARGIGDQEAEGAVVGYDHVMPRADAEQHAAAFLDNAPSQPFYLEVGFFETHRYGGITSKTNNGAFNTPQRVGDGRYVQAPAPLPDAPATRADMADYIVAARRLDDKVGQVFDALKRNGLWENTLVIFTTDHGIPFPGMKCSLTDHGMGVALIVRGPGFEGGQVVDGMVSHINVFPTLCECLQIEKPAWLEGRSMLPLVRGEAAEINEQIFGEVTYHATYEPKRAVRTPRWKYIRHFDEQNTPVLKNCDASPSKDLLLAHGWGEEPVAREQLYDLIFDPNESDNLAASAAHAPVLDEMRARLDTWMRETHDPLLDGPVAAPVLEN